MATPGGHLLNAVVSPRIGGPWRGPLPPTLSIVSNPSTLQAEQRVLFLSYLVCFRNSLQ